MQISYSINSLVRSLSKDRMERRIIAGSLISLFHKREFFLQSISPFVRLIPYLHKSKLELWRAIALAFSGRKIFIDSNISLLLYLKSTQAYIDLLEKHKKNCFSYYFRQINYNSAALQLKKYSIKRLFIFHHYDRRGYFPVTWINYLIAIKKDGWTVIISTSNIEHTTEIYLESLDMVIAKRNNIGLCLGAYKDLLMLLQDRQLFVMGIDSLVLCNDSTLPILDDSKLLSHLNKWVDEYELVKHPVISGFTDSSERGFYHLQTYFLYVNSSCLKSSFWTKFWLNFNPYQDKDQLIDDGEIGLSQHAILNGVTLKTSYPLIKSLFTNNEISIELKGKHILEMSKTNQTLYAWQYLIKNGFPFIKKRVVFDSALSFEKSFSITSLNDFIPSNRRELFINDLCEIFISRNLPYINK